MAAGGEWPLLLTALFAGLLGSGHCFGMCGGIAASFGALDGADGSRQHWAPGLVFNAGRILSYVALGILGAWLLGGAGAVFDVPHWSRILRAGTAAIILVIGLRFLLNLRLVDRIERAGAGIWRRVQPTAVRLSARPGAAGRLALGMCWGLLPCGLVYSMLLLAASTGRPLWAALTMAAFGFGTLPSMLGMTWLSPVLRELLSDPLVRRCVGLSLIVLSLWTLAMLVDLD